MNIVQVNIVHWTLSTIERERKQSSTVELKWFSIASVHSVFRRLYGIYNRTVLKVSVGREHTRFAIKQPSPPLLKKSAGSDCKQNGARGANTVSRIQNCSIILRIRSRLIGSWSWLKDKIILLKLATKFWISSRTAARCGSCAVNSPLSKCIHNPSQFV